MLFSGGREQFRGHQHFPNQHRMGEGVGGRRRKLLWNSQGRNSKKVHFVGFCTVFSANFVHDCSMDRDLTVIRYSLQLNSLIGVLLVVFTVATDGTDETLAATLDATVTATWEDIITRLLTPKEW